MMTKETTFNINLSTLPKGVYLLKYALMLNLKQKNHHSLTRL